MEFEKDIWAKKISQWNRRRILVWTTTAVAFLTAYFHRTVIGVVSDSLMRDFAIEHAADLGLLASIYFWTYAALQLPAGILADVVGPRRVVALAMLVAAVGSLLFGLAENLTLLYLGRFITTLGIGVIFVSLIKLQADWFRMREFATMSGLIVLIGNSGSLLSATPMAFIVDSWGWRTAFYLMAGYSLLMASACWCIVRNRPEDVGFPSTAEIEAQEGNPPTSQPKFSVSIIDCIKSVCLNRNTWPPVVAGATIYGVYMAIIGVWGIPYFMQVYGMSRIDASQLILVMAIGNMIGAPTLGILSDRTLCRRWPYISATVFFLSSLLLLTLWNGAKPPSVFLYPICFCFGLGVSGLNLSVACAKEVNPPYATGIAAGITNSGPFIGAAIMQPAFGWVLDQHWAGAAEQGIKIYPQSAYASAFWLCIGVLSIGLLASCCIHETRCGMEKR